MSIQPRKELLVALLDGFTTTLDVMKQPCKLGIEFAELHHTPHLFCYPLIGKRFLLSCGIGIPFPFHHMVHDHQEGNAPEPLTMLLRDQEAIAWGICSEHPTLEL